MHRNLPVLSLPHKGDDLWSLSHKDLIALAIEELSTLDLADASDPYPRTDGSQESG